MGHQTQRGHRGRPGQAFASAGDDRGAKSQAVHPSVDLHEHLQRPGQHRGLEHLHLLDVVHNNGEPALRNLFQLAFRKKAFEQQDAAQVALLTQSNRGIEFEQRQTVGVLQRGQHPRQTVAVGIGLDDCEDLRPRRLFAHARQVLAHRGQVDLCVKRTRHPGENALRERGSAQTWYKTPTAPLRPL